MTELLGRTALITGGSRGIGKAIALRLAADGAAVAVTYSTSPEAAAVVVDTITGKGGTAFALQVDITDTTAIEALFDAAVERLGQLDILVNNAGVAIAGPIAATSEEAYDQLFAITKGTFFMLKQASTRLADNGRIVNLSTGLTRTWPGMSAAYAGSKAAVEQFTKGLSKDVGARGITVNAVLPGVVETDMTAGMPAPMKEAAARNSSLGRLGAPDDIADVVAFLASDDARWITGQLIVANGGTTP